MTAPRPGVADRAGGAAAACGAPCAEPVPPEALRSASEEYRHRLGRLLAEGLSQNEFAFPPEGWPPRTPARRYIREFLGACRTHIRGRCVEFAPAVYRREFGSGAAVTAYDVWSIAAGPGVTLVADAEDCSELPDARFDTILCTHVLSALRRPWRATAEFLRLLAPGGVLLVTVPVILQQYAPDPLDCWRFSRDGLATLLEGFRRIELYAYGNAATVAGSPMFLMEEHFPAEALAWHDPRCPSVIAAAAWK